MGLRHIPVVTIDHEVVGILTRKNFMIHDHSYLPHAATSQPSSADGNLLNDGFELTRLHHTELFDDPPTEMMP
jgi:hypothetical protein